MLWQLRYYCQNVSQWKITQEGMRSSSASQCAWQHDILLYNEDSPWSSSTSENWVKPHGRTNDKSSWHCKSTIEDNGRQYEIWTTLNNSEQIRKNKETMQNNAKQHNLLSFGTNCGDLCFDQLSWRHDPTKATSCWCWSITPCTKEQYSSALHIGIHVHRFLLPVPLVGQWSHLCTSQKLHSH